MEDQVSKLKKEITELKRILYVIASPFTTCCNSNGLLKYDHNKEDYDQLKTFKNIPDDLSDCEVDMKYCLYQWIGPEGYETPVLLGYIDYVNETFYKINEV